MNDDGPRLPGMQDLWNLLRFEAQEGRIWLDEERVVLLRSSELRGLRRELIDALGMQRAKGLLTRMGYISGKMDAERARRLRPEASLFDVFSVGPQSHMVTGQVKVIPQKLDWNEEENYFHAIFDWENSFEAEIFLSEFGSGFEPVCWAQIGYASGFTTQFMGRQIYFKETCCTACGHQTCRIEGRLAEDWEDAEDAFRHYQPDRIADQLFELQEQMAELRSRVDAEEHFGQLVGSSPRFLEVRDLLSRAARSKVTVLLLGETGVGKDMFARALHEASDRADKPFVAINCAAIPRDLIEAELFGVERGAFTGAEKTRPGRFERADTGTLFLDEVGELSLHAQAALLRVLQEGELERVGGSEVRQVDVRLIAATNEDLDLAVREGRFRQDLLYRLNVYSATVPPLRERIEDLPDLVNHFLDKYGTLHGKTGLSLTDRAMALLRDYDWPGNIRELANVMERGVILSDPGGQIEAAHLFPGVSGTRGDGSAAAGEQTLPELAADAIDAGHTLEAVERELIDAALVRAGHKVSGAARLLGLTRAQLDYRLKKRQEAKNSSNHENGS